jgi:hypothetical protein
MQHPIIDDIVQHKRTFLGAANCTPDEVRKHFDDSILVDGLDREESELVLSVLGSGLHRIYLKALDKGLSGSKVYSGRYETPDGRASMPLIFKLGPLKKIEDEFDAINNYVVNRIGGISSPYIRKHSTTGLLVQSIAGLTSRSTLTSLKEYVRTSSDPEAVVYRLLGDRLSGWYDGHLRHQSQKPHRLRQVFKWYLNKVGTGDPFPADWADLKVWVENATGLGWNRVPEILEHLKDSDVLSQSTIIHGDLHSQNILIDERGECWPIDFYWCQDSTPILDFVMLECSLKFLAIHQRSDLRSVIEIENGLAREPFPTMSIPEIPYRGEIANVLRAIQAVRHFAMDKMRIRFDDYRRALCLMTYVHSTHPKLNRPLILASLQILTALEQK